MIGKLKGIVDTVEEDWAIIDVGGVGYQVFASPQMLRRLPAPGSPCSVLIETHVREDQIRLFGFLDASERDWFRLLQSVQGVGTRVALAVLGVLSPAALARAIASEDKKAISAAPGVGPKVAQRIISELKDKLPADAAAMPVAVGAPEAAAPGTVAMRDAVSALVNLGYSQAQALSAVSAAAAKLPEEGSAELLIRHGLKELAR